MTKADKMFERAGYTLNEDYIDIIRYERKILGIKGRAIEFDLRNKCVDILILNHKQSNANIEHFESLGIDEIKAICNKTKELGWIK